MRIGSRVPRDAHTVSIDQLPWALSLVGIDPDTWHAPEGEKPPFQKLIDEMRAGECLLRVETDTLLGTILVRYITTVTVRISYDFYEDKRLLGPHQINLRRSLVLQEFRVLPDRSRIPRPFLNSASEKVRTLEELNDPRLVVRRLCHEELRMHLTEEELTPPLLQPLPPKYVPPHDPKVRITHTVHNGYPIEENFHPSHALPGIYTHNSLIHLMLKLLAKRFRPGGYAEPRTNHVFEWMKTFVMADADFAA
jgi:hypothetical protein